MAARRLVAVMLLLLALSTLAAALVPAPPRRGGTTTDSRTEPGTRILPAPRPAGRLVRATLDAGRPRTIVLQDGDQLRLTVRAPVADQVEIAGFGLVEPVEPRTPAVFDLIADRPGSYTVRLLRPARTVGLVRVQRGALTR